MVKPKSISKENERMLGIWLMLIFLYAPNVLRSGKGRSPGAASVLFMKISQQSEKSGSYVRSAYKCQRNQAEKPQYGNLTQPSVNISEVGINTAWCAVLPTISPMAICSHGLPILHGGTYQTTVTATANAEGAISSMNTIHTPTRNGIAKNLVMTNTMRCTNDGEPSGNSKTLNWKKC